MGRDFITYKDFDMPTSVRDDFETYRCNLVVRSAQADANTSSTYRIDVPALLFTYYKLACPTYYARYARYDGHRGNAGQLFESVHRWLMGESPKADGVAYNLAPDMDSTNSQLKRGRASVIHGTDVEHYLATSASTNYWYSPDDTVVYVMGANAYGAFSAEFGKPMQDSRSNGGNWKLKINNISKALLAWLESHRTA